MIIASTIAPAKLNLALRVGAARADGFHDLRSIFVAIDLVDDVRVSLGDGDTIRVQGDQASGVRAGAENLALRAAQLLRARYDLPPLAIDLVKRIPTASGLGGGSSDAAAVIRAVDALLHLSLPIDEQASLGAELGSDVPFFVHGGAALVEGRGERVTPLPFERLRFLLAPLSSARPEKTARLFAALDAARQGESVGKPGVTWPPRGDRDLANDFERVRPQELAESEAAWRAFAAAGIVPHLSGAGPSVFGLASAGGAPRVSGTMAVAALSPEASQRVIVA